MAKDCPSKAKANEANAGSPPQSTAPATLAALAITSKSNGRDVWVVDSGATPPD